MSKASDLSKDNKKKKAREKKSQRVLALLLDVLWGQLIKLIQIFLHQNFMNIDGKTDIENENF